MSKKQTEDIKKVPGPFNCPKCGRITDGIYISKHKTECKFVDCNKDSWGGKSPIVWNGTGSIDVEEED